MIIRKSHGLEEDQFGLVDEEEGLINLINEEITEGKEQLTYPEIKWLALKEDKEHPPCGQNGIRPKKEPEYSKEQPVYA